MRLRFLGAARNVTGSRHLLEANGQRFLVDCGLYQERQFQERNWAPFAVDPQSIDAVFLTHAHLDHCGLLPKLVRDGFKGRIYCTEATAELARIILVDAARLQEEDAEFKQKRHKREEHSGPFPVVPLYTVEDAEACFPLFTPVKYRQVIDMGQGMEVQMCEAGHVLGSAVMRVSAHKNGTSRTVLFSGDIGRPHRPIVRDPSVVHAADYILVESTYGNHVHHDRENIKKVLAETINKTLQAGGNIIVPSFALERSQEVLYYINELILERIIPHLSVFLDSPMAAAITKVFEHHPELFDREMTTHLRNHESPFKFPDLKITDTKSKSQSIKDIKGSIMIISGSGMCTGGRVKHHLVNDISRAESTVLFVGYQASGTLGRLLVDGEPEVRILGQTYPVKARIVQVHGFSAHADKEELLTWLQAVERPPRKVFVVHGEADSALHFVDFLKEKTGWDVTAPAYGDVVELN